MCIRDRLCDMTRPLGTFLINFERDTDRDWNLYGLSPLRQALHSNRWNQPELEQAASEFLWEKYLSNDPLKMYVAFRILSLIHIYILSVFVPFVFCVLLS